MSGGELETKSNNEEMEQTSGGDGEEWKTNEDLVDPAVATSPECMKTASARGGSDDAGGD